MPLREPPRTSDDRVLDAERLLEITGGSRDVAQELLALLIDDGERLVAEIRSAVASRNDGVVRAAAHALKGSAGNVGAPRLERAARAMEACAGVTDDVALAAALAALEDELTKVVVRGRTFGRTIERSSTGV
jgi:two-component system sensor histidine kinase/response regulator